MAKSWPLASLGPGNGGLSAILDFCRWALLGGKTNNSGLALAWQTARANLDWSNFQLQNREWLINHYCPDQSLAKGPGCAVLDFK